MHKIVVIHYSTMLWPCI